MNRLMAFLFVVRVFALALGRPAPALAAPVMMQMALAGAQEISAVTTAGSGVAQLSVAGLTVQFTLSLSGLDATEVTAAHIHRGNPGHTGVHGQGCTNGDRRRIWW